MLDPDAESDPDPDAESDPDTESDPDPDAESDPDPDADPDTESDPDSDADSDSDLVLVLASGRAWGASCPASRLLVACPPSRSTGTPEAELQAPADDATRAASNTIAGARVGSMRGTIAGSGPPPVSAHARPAP